MNKKIHVHIYRTSAMAEIDVEAENPFEARQIVHDMLRNELDTEEFDYKKPDTERIIMTFEDIETGEKR